MSTCTEANNVLIKPKIITDKILKGARLKLDWVTHIIHPSLRKYAYFHPVRGTRLWQLKARNETKVKAKAQSPQSPSKDFRKKASTNFKD